ncbi:MAG TPA: hypothetical protein VIW92_07640 [Thermoanaerobaculia bacterium]
MRLTNRVFFGLALLLGLTMTALAADRPSLSGTWHPDRAASAQSKELKTKVDPKAPPAPPAPSAGIQEDLPVMRVTHAEPKVTIEFLEDNGSVISTTAITTDGKDALNSRAGGALSHRSTSVWDGSVLVTTWSLEREGAAVISGVDRWELTSPTTLVVTTTTEDSKSRSKSAILYRRGR